MFLLTLSRRYHAFIRVRFLHIHDLLFNSHVACFLSYYLVPYLCILLFLFHLAALLNSFPHCVGGYFLLFLSFLDLAWEASGFERLWPLGNFVYLLDTVVFLFLSRDLSGQIV